MQRFLIGFFAGLLVGVAAVVLTAPRRGQPQGAGAILDGALGAARRAASLREQELWADYRARVQSAAQPPAPRQRPY